MRRVEKERTLDVVRRIEGERHVAMQQLIHEVMTLQQRNNKLMRRIERVSRIGEGNVEMKEENPLDVYDWVVDIQSVRERHATVSCTMYDVLCCASPATRIVAHVCYHDVACVCYHDEEKCCTSLCMSDVSLSHAQTSVRTVRHGLACLVLPHILSLVH